MFFGMKNVNKNENIRIKVTSSMAPLEMQKFTKKIWK